MILQYLYEFRRNIVKVCSCESTRRSYRIRRILLDNENYPMSEREIWHYFNNTFFSFQIRNPILYEVNGTSQYCKKSDSLKISPVSEELVPLLERPIEFEYKEGKVGKIHCADDEPEYILNIKRGILSILHHNLTKPEPSIDDREPRMYKNWEVIYFFHNTAFVNRPALNAERGTYEF